MSDTPKPPLRIGLFATCLMNLFRPTIGFAAAKLLEDAGCILCVPQGQTCCGQPGYNSGDNGSARALAKQVIATFEDYDYVVGPSGSCMATIRHDYPVLLAEDHEWRDRATAVAAKSWELTSFLVDVLGITSVQARLDGIVTYHDSCSGLRGLGIKGQPRQLLAGVEGLTLHEMTDSEVCCGFGGTFCVKYPEISVKMVDDKIRNIRETGADTLIGGDLGCLMNIAGRLSRNGSPIRVFHTAEVLAGMAEGPGIGDGRS
ncbi:(Fe-S)-binding protein [Thiocapsa bogorovii]|uniref:(Fe-S)-binding protein n=1 Tax=Thiocapsa bogorovii TaxID=521689 RepID=UPI001E3DABF1|nr:(Fe-S)-binding protein [Thiocapsa bogorovii]UHD14339.1 (Fe-S)-binding protein [Thiocapsa bogorovii]